MSGIQAPWIGCSYEDYEERFKDHYHEYDYENDEYYTDEDEEYKEEWELDEANDDEEN